MSQLDPKTTKTWRSPDLAGAEMVIASTIADLCSDGNACANSVASDVLDALNSAGYLVFRGNPTT